MVFGILRAQERVKSSILLSDLNRDPRQVVGLLCHYGNEFGEFIPFQLICNNAMIVAALSEIFRK